MKIKDKVVLRKIIFYCKDYGMYVYKKLYFFNQNTAIKLSKVT